MSADVEQTAPDQIRETVREKYAESARVCRELLELKTGDGKPREVLVSVTGRFDEPEFMPDDNYDIGKRLRPFVHELLIQAITKQGKYDQALKLVDTLVKAQPHWDKRQLRAWVLRERTWESNARRVVAIAEALRSQRPAGIAEVRG